MQIESIKTVVEHQAILDEIDELMDAKLGTPEGDRLIALAALIEAFEAENFPIDLEND
ncbi:hypothetical protein ACN9MZ_26100 [Pseudoduganella sp. S-14]|uniref:hypothetical protein n=1 Tax=Pseudoduganella sp. S-14 TaxID=3404065 RepID=UPI003CF17924